MAISFEYRVVLYEYRYMPVSACLLALFEDLLFVMIIIFVECLSLNEESGTKCSAVKSKSGLSI